QLVFSRRRLDSRPLDARSFDGRERETNDTRERRKRLTGFPLRGQERGLSRDQIDAEDIQLWTRSFAGLQAPIENLDDLRAQLFFPAQPVTPAYRQEVLQQP